MSSDVQELIEGALAERELQYTRHPGARGGLPGLVVVLPGERNRRLYGVAYTLDNTGDIYLVGRMALESVTADEIDRVLGQVLEAVDNDFNTLLELGFRSSIQKEWAWRVERGESLQNLEAFAHLIEDD